jgi:hypothetical protein
MVLKATLDAAGGDNPLPSIIAASDCAVRCMRT